MGDESGHSSAEERLLAKQKVASSILAARSSITKEGSSPVAQSAGATTSHSTTETRRARRTAGVWLLPFTWRSREGGALPGRAVKANVQENVPPCSPCLRGEIQRCSASLRSTVGVRFPGMEETEGSIPSGGSTGRHSTVAVHLSRNQGTQVRFLLSAPVGVWRSLVSALRSGRRGRRFESDHSDHERNGGRVVQMARTPRRSAS